MKILLVKNKDDEYGELVEINELFAKMLIKLGKAKENGGFGAKIGDLYWCGESEVTEAKLKQEKGGANKKVYTTKRLRYSILKKPSVDKDVDFVNLLGARKTKKLCNGDCISVKHTNNGIRYLNLYPTGSELHRNIKASYFDVYNIVQSCPVVDHEKPLKKVLKSRGLWQEDWNDDTFLTTAKIAELEKELMPHYQKNINTEKEIIV